MHDTQPGTLYVVATPIGHRDDLSPRARRVLAAVDVIAAEDTRTSGAFLRDLGIATRMLSLHEHNERERVSELLERLAAGEAVALISDAGTPLISDPGFVLVRAVREAGRPVLSVPGPCAAIAALSVAGLPTDRFFFAGFVAAKPAAREKQLRAVAALDATLVFYASKRTLGAALAEAAAVLGPARPAAIARELTKLHEQTVDGTLGGLADAWASQESRGEWVLLIGGAEPVPADEAALARTLDVLCEHLSTRDAAAAAARLLGVSRRAAYAAALARDAE